MVSWARMTRKALPVLILLSIPACWAAEKVTVLRDEFGVPHIFASTPAGAMFGSGYAQAEDRLEELLKNYRRAEGTMAEVFGKEYLEQDYRQRLWRHRFVSEQNYPKLAPDIRRMCEAFQAGIKKFMAEHPEQVPAWAPKLEPWQIIALGRYIIYRWPEGEAGSDLKNGGLQPIPVPYRGSNQMLIAPSRSALKAPIAVIDPHLSWYGEVRFYEVRLYAGDFAMSGATILGIPFPTLGHSRYASVAMTTGGPDTADIFEEEIAGGKYKFRGELRPVETRQERIGVKDGSAVKWQQIEVVSTHHGPVVARKDGKAYTAAIAYRDQFRMIEQTWAMHTARNLAEMKKALAGLQYMAQNIMVGTVDGDIYYLRNGRVPVRPKGCDPSRPQPGAGACEWQGLHKFEELVQVTNPPQGYMQNCNTSPYWMMKDSPLVPEKWAEHPYLYNASKAPTHQRAAMMLELLARTGNVTLEKITDIAFSPEVYGAELWQERVRKAAPSHELTRTIVEWNRRADADSRAALVFSAFKMALPGLAAREVAPSASLADAQIVAALDAAAKRLRNELPPGATWGTLFRVGRTGSQRTWPVSGGTVTDAGMATPRAISFNFTGTQFIGRSGQTSTQIVVLTKPPQSWSVIPLGESDHPESGHFEDQAEKLFSKSRVKSTYFLNRAELEKHITARKELQF
jgi:acyl-homoserine-lactone acylase